MWPSLITDVIWSGGEITSTFDHPELVKLGHCKLIEEVMIGEDTLIHFSGVAMGTNTHWGLELIFHNDILIFSSSSSSGEACTVVLRGATQQILDEAERSLHDALCVLAQTVKEPRTVYGGGRRTYSWSKTTALSSFFAHLTAEHKKCGTCGTLRFLRMGICVSSIIKLFLSWMQSPLYRRAYCL